MISYALHWQQDFTMQLGSYLVVLSLAICTIGTNTALADENISESLIGTSITEPAWNEETKARLEKNLEIAQAVMEIAPEREDSHIWLGRRLGYLARNGEAVDVFTEGLEQFPDSYKLLRFRGRHLARNRAFERAIADYKRAAELVEYIQDSYEPDGIINARHQYLGTYRSNIHYYLGQTSWAIGDYQATLDGMTRAASEPLVQHDDRRIATGFWQYLALRKLGRHDEAAAVVAEIPEDLELVENFDYYDGVRFFKGTLSEDELLPRAGLNAKFSIAMVNLIEGRTAKGREMLRDLVADSSQGYWPAESELLALNN
jgi:tetratricopeptide (TPR) repeat protein